MLRGCLVVWIGVVEAIPSVAIFWDVGAIHFCGSEAVWHVIWRLELLLMLILLSIYYRVIACKTRLSMSHSDRLSSSCGLSLGFLFGARYIQAF
jgi:hypothetical protein